MTTLSERSQAFERRRTHALVTGAAAFAGWQITECLRPLAPDARLPLALLSLVAIAVWVASLVRTLQLTRTLKGDPALSSAMQDERVRYARLRALALGFWVVLLAQAVILGVVGLGIVVPTMLAARLSLALGVVAAAVGFVAYERA
jgi:hypothetical protein